MLWFGSLCEICIQDRTLYFFRYLFGCEYMNHATSLPFCGGQRMRIEFKCFDWWCVDWEEFRKDEATIEEASLNCVWSSVQSFYGFFFKRWLCAICRKAHDVAKYYISIVSFVEFKAFIKRDHLKSCVAFLKRGKIFVFFWQLIFVLQLVTVVCYYCA